MRTTSSSSFRSTSLFSAAVGAAFLMQGAWAAPGERVAGPVNAKAKASAATLAASGNALQEFYSANGHVYLSADGSGTNAGSALIEVEKRSAQSVVRKAFLLAASTGFSGHQITDTDLRLNGVAVDVDESTLIPSSISSYNVRADVTSIVKPVVDAAGPGRVSLEIAEASSSSIDGEVLAVIFDDPNEPTGSVALLYGAQNTGGDSFAVRLSDPIDSRLTQQKLSMSLGISFGFQTTSTTVQFSQIDVNGVRLTSSAGGQDDGVASNGALITVGGLDDSTDNPADPLAGPGCATAPRCDDELYDLKAVLADGTTSIQVDTRNPSNDDNIFFTAFSSANLAAIVNEGIVLSPSSQERKVGEGALIVASVQDAVGGGVPNREVTFSVTSGPDAGATSTVLTAADGSANYALTCTKGGTDVVSATFVDSNGVSKQSNESSLACVKAESQITAKALLSAGGLKLQATLTTAGSGAPLTGKTITFYNARKEVCAAVTDASGVATCPKLLPFVQATLTLGYTATFAGDDSATPASVKAKLLTLGPITVPK